MEQKYIARKGEVPHKKGNETIELFPKTFDITNEENEPKPTLSKEEIYAGSEAVEYTTACQRKKSKSLTRKRFILIIVGMVVGMVTLSAVMSTITALILKRDFDNRLTQLVDQESSWLEWTHWSECSVSCSGGMQRRTRTCHGSDNGRHVCVGNDVDISACNNNTCLESNWLEWTHWSECSVSCSGGIQRRTRTCNGPDKGPHVCVGNDFDISACNNTCVDNSWSSWSPWGDCGVSCNGGIRTRTRSCDGTGIHQGSCLGTNVDIGGCNNNACVVPMVYFTMTSPSSPLRLGKVKFTTTRANVGGGYNKQTGEFVCPVSGLYHFFFSFTQLSTTIAGCYIRHNGRSLTPAYTSSDEDTNDAASTSAYIQLVVGDVVTVEDCMNSWVSFGSWEGVFTGSLIHL